MTSAERIDEVLRERGMSRRLLAIKAGIPPSTLQSAIERNKNIPVKMLGKIASTLGVVLYTILGDDERALFVAAEDDAFVNLVAEGYSFSDSEKLLVRLFGLLNEVGKDEALTRIEELSELAKYRRKREDFNNG